MSAEETRFFQYLQGPRQGDIVVYDSVVEDDGEVYVVFKDESRVNEELIMSPDDRKYTSQLMAEISNPNNAWSFREEWVGRQEERWETGGDGNKVCVQPFVKGRRKVHLIPPKKQQSIFGAVSKSATPPANVQQAAPNAVIQDTTDPVYIMMEKARKADTNVEMTVTISLPTKSLYNVAEESFEDGGEKVIEYIVNNLDTQKLKDSLKESLKQAYTGSITITTMSPNASQLLEVGKDPLPWQQGTGVEEVEEPVVGAPIAQENNNEE